MENKSEEKELDNVSEVNLKEDFQSSGVADILLELDNSLIGLEPVKTRIRETASLLWSIKLEKSWAWLMSLQPYI